MKSRHARLWFRFRGTSGQRWTVLLVTPTLMASCLPRGDSRVVGLTIVSADGLYLVLVDASQPRREQDETLHHELMHVAATESDERLTMAHEERAVSAISPRLHATLRGVGGLRWPRRPNGCLAFERFARSTSEEE